MISRWEWIWAQFTRRLWFRAALYGISAVLVALFAVALGPFIPEDASQIIGADAVGEILTIIASSMLAVATFSLSTMVGAFAAVASAATPRATSLFVDDTTSQNALSSFIGAFLFSLVGLIALSTGYYGPGGRVVLYLFTIVLVLAIVITFFRWIDYLSHLGRMSVALRRVEEATQKAVDERWAYPHLGGQPLIGIPPASKPVYAERIGYVQHLDMAALQSLTKDKEGTIYVVSLPGSYVDAGRPIAFVDFTVDDECQEDLRDAFLVNDVRSFPQDPRFGLIVMSEIASRALSPGINDPGTAIDVIGRLVRILSRCTADVEVPADVQYPNVCVPALSVDDMLDDAFTPIARDGAGTVEVAIRLQKAFASLAQLRSPALQSAVERHADMALRRSLAALTLDEDKRAVRRCACARSEDTRTDGG